MGGESSHDQGAGDGGAAARASALDLMDRALVVLDRVGPLQAAAMLALAIELAGGAVAPPPR